jgi:uncharacterized membrane protein YhiD involved in acid resistance
MEKRDSNAWIYTKGILVMIGAVVAFIVGISLVFQLVSTIEDKAYRIVAAIVAYVAFIYMFGRVVPGIITVLVQNLTKWRVKGYKVWCELFSY